jgi:hypothetical protein
MSGKQEFSNAEAAPLTLEKRLRDIAVSVASTQMINANKQLPMTDDQLEAWISKPFDP